MVSKIHMYTFNCTAYLLRFPQVTGHEELEQVTGVVSSLDIPQFGEDLKVKPISLTSDLCKQLTGWFSVCIKRHWFGRLITTYRPCFQCSSDYPAPRLGQELCSPAYVWMYLVTIYNSLHIHTSFEWLSCWDTLLSMLSLYKMAALVSGSVREYTTHSKRSLNCGTRLRIYIN